MLKMKNMRISEEHQGFMNIRIDVIDQSWEYMPKTLLRLFRLPPKCIRPGILRKALGTGAGVRYRQLPVTRRQVTAIPVQKYVCVGGVKSQPFAVEWIFDSDKACAVTTHILYEIETDIQS